MIVTLGIEVIGADDVHQHLRTVVTSRRRDTADRQTRSQLR